MKKNRQGYTLSMMLVVSVFFAVVLTSCADRFDYALPDYTHEDAIAQEIAKAEGSLADDPIDTVYRMCLLQESGCTDSGVEPLLEKGLVACLARFNTAVEKKEWTRALRYFRSLDALEKAPIKWNEKKLLQKQSEGFSAKQKTSHHAHLQIPQDAEQVISGTATVFVDKGLTIQKGVGFADSVIGSGFFIDKRGYFITNYHVIESEVDPEYEGYSRLYIKQAGKANTKIPAKVVGWDPLLDLALLKVPVTPDFVFTLGSSQNLNVGSRIYAIGSPAGLESTLTAGIVSGNNRKFLFHGTVLQIDAAINPGSSGGPVIDEKARVQAVAFAGLQQFEGLNFAIPVELLKAVLPQLYAGGKVEHSWIGAFGSPEESSKNRVKKDKAKGVELLYTLPLSSAHYGVLMAGDRIVRLNGTAVNSVEGIKDLLFKLSPETLLRVEIIREKNGETNTVTRYLKSEARPQNPLKRVYEHDSLARAFMPLFGAQLRSTGKRGCYRVSKILQGSFVHETGFSLEDYIELSSLNYDEAREALYTQIYTKRRSAGYVGTFMALYSPLDKRSFF